MAKRGGQRGNKNALKHGKYTRERRALLADIRAHVRKTRALLADCADTKAPPVHGKGHARYAAFQPVLPSRKI